jgi:hypothetical protein
MMRARDIFEHYVARHNAGVGGQGFDALLEMFADDARLEFRGIDVGPFQGKPAIRRAFVERPPSNELTLISSAGEGSSISAVYGWSTRPGVRAGTLQMELSHMKIVRLVVGVD